MPIPKDGVEYETPSDWPASLKPNKYSKQVFEQHDGYEQPVFETPIKRTEE